MRMEGSIHPRGLAGDAHIGRERDGEAPATGRAVHQRDHWLRAAPHAPDDLAEAPLLGQAFDRVLVPSDGGLLDVHPGAESAPRPAQHDHPARRVLHGRAEIVQQVLDHGMVERIEPVRTVEGDPVGGTAPLDGDRGVARLAHGF